MNKHPTTKLPKTLEGTFKLLQAHYEKVETTYLCSSLFELEEITVAQYREAKTFIEDCLGGAFNDLGSYYYLRQGVRVSDERAIRKDWLKWLLANVANTANVEPTDYILPSLPMPENLRPVFEMVRNRLLSQRFPYICFILRDLEDDGYITEAQLQAAKDFIMDAFEGLTTELVEYMMKKAGCTDREDMLQWKMKYDRLQPRIDWLDKMLAQPMPEPEPKRRFPDTPCPMHIKAIFRKLDYSPKPGSMTFLCCFIGDSHLSLAEKEYAVGFINKALGSAGFGNGTRTLNLWLENEHGSKQQDVNQNRKEWIEWLKS